MRHCLVGLRRVAQTKLICSPECDLFLLRFRLNEVLRENAKLKESLKTMSMAEGAPDSDPSTSSISEDGKDSANNGPEDRGAKTRALLEELWTELDTKREEIHDLREALAREAQEMTHVPNRKYLATH